MALNHPVITPSAVKHNALAVLQAGQVPFIQSSPGLGKSSLAKQIAEDHNLELIDIRLSQCTPEDLMGLPMKMENESGRMVSTFLPFDIFPLEDTPLPKGKSGWLILFDEFNSATKSVQAAAYRPVLDHEIGQRKLHPNARIICAGNLVTDKAIVTPLGTAMQSRVTHLLMKADFGEWMDWAIKNGIDHRVTGFLDFQPSKLHMFNPDHAELTFPCPRTWEFISKIIKGRSALDSILPAIQGTIGAGVGFEFKVFCDEYDRLPKLASILADPLNIMVPHEMSTRYAAISMLMAHIKPENAAPILKYVDRFKPEEKLIFCRGAINRDASLRSIDEMNELLVRVMQFVNS